MGYRSWHYKFAYIQSEGKEAYYKEHPLLPHEIKPKKKPEFDQVSYNFYQDTSQLITNNMQFSEEAVILEGLRLVGAGLATIGLTGAGVGIGAVFGAFLMALGRNPNLKDMMFGYLLLGFALTEAIALFALMMAFLILFF